jgi:HIRAN domain
MLMCRMGMLDFFKSKQRSVTLSVLPLSGDGYCAVVGESHYQEALGGTAGLCSLDENGERVFQAFLVREPNNPYDSNAIAVYSSHGQLGYLSRENAEAYLDVLEELAERGYDGGACDAILRGGTPDKPSYGVVLRLADPDSCYADLGDEGG